MNKQGIWSAVAILVLVLAAAVVAHAQYGLGNLWTDGVYIDNEPGGVGWYESGGPDNDLAAIIQYTKSSETMEVYVGWAGTSALDVNVVISGEESNLYDFNVLTAGTFTISQPTALASYANCNTIDTDANGLLSCGTDAGALVTSGADNEVARLDGTTNVQGSVWKIDDTTGDMYTTADSLIYWYEAGETNNQAAAIQYVKSTETMSFYAGTDGVSKMDWDVTNSNSTRENLMDYNVTSGSTFTINKPITMLGTFIAAVGGLFAGPITVQAGSGISNQQIVVEDYAGDNVVTIGAGDNAAGRIQLGTDADDTTDWEIQWTATNTATIPSGDTLTVTSYLTVGDILTATPQAGKGATCATQGQVYYSSTDNVPCFCDGTNWKKITDGTTNCS